MSGNGLPWRDGSIEHNTQWAQNTRIVPVLKVLVQMFALGVAVRTAFLAFFLDGALPGVVTAAVEKVGINPDDITGKGAPLVWKMNEIIGIDATAYILASLLGIVVGFMYLRTGMLARLLRAARTPGMVEPGTALV